MSDSQLVFEWLTGFGWLLLSGGKTPDSTVRDVAINRSTSEGGVAYISFAPDGGDGLLDDMQDLGAPSGYIVDLNDDSNAVYDYIESASIVIVESGNHLDGMIQKLQGAPLSAMKAGLNRGSVILLEGLVASAFGDKVIGDDGTVKNGFAWVKSAIIETGLTSVSETATLRDILSLNPQITFIGIDKGSGLALGPNRQIELLGEKQVSITLGSGFQSS